MLIRHAEKPLGNPPPHGVTIDGVTDSESLTPLGWQRAGALVGLFAGSASAAHREQLATPSHLFASQVGTHSSSRRPLETIQPLASRLGLTVDTSFLKEGIGELVAGIRGTPGVVLVSWEHHLIPSISNMIVGDTSTVPQLWPDDRFDIVWAFDRDRATGRYRFRQIPQLLLAGDVSSPIAPPDGATAASPQVPPATL